MWFLPAVVTAVATVVAAFAVQSGARAAVIWCGAVATFAVALLAAEVARRGTALAAARDEHAEREERLRSRLARQEAATTNLAQTRLPEAVARLQEGEFAEDVLLSMEGAADELSAEFLSAHHELLRSVVEAVQAEETLRDSAQRGVVNIARRVQAVVHQQARDLREMEDRHGRRPDFFSDLLKLDHGTALIGRLADSIAVLGGARPGRQWSRPVPLYSVLRGAMSRITDYQRIELHSVVEVAVVGPAVEPLIHALAELLDNATRYSPPKARVHLTASEVHAGIAVEIEDGGVGLSEEARARAEQMLKEAQAGIDLNDLGEAPRLGLAVVGRLAQAYDFQVSLPPSAYGGVRAVLVVPKRLITTAPATARAHGIGATGEQHAAVAADGPVGHRAALTAPMPPLGRCRPATPGRPVGLGSRMLVQTAPLPVQRKPTVLAGASLTALPTAWGMDVRPKRLPGLKRAAASPPRDTRRSRIRRRRRRRRPADCRSAAAVGRTRAPPAASPRADRPTRRRPRRTTPTPRCPACGWPISRVVCPARGGRRPAPRSSRDTTSDEGE